ncbi:MAG: DUF3422 domain-containing protein [Paracoccus sp. (in: a-proteobacteria)]|uniref:DUF3422 family protein n=1 Tax=Paracoccus sp. TaxID=267 RepID=UPI0026E0C5B6|nr:DUF3422 domain-containing protein [Paracoccus sp. (in: a-proteobacteria)]MDO5612211.1 DUF3422 domain-containing protein [Paracoccus sp. (in: a-proteobacteria)]
MKPDDDHPLRYALVNELHARPSPRVMPPATVAYLAIKEPRDAVGRNRARDYDHLSALVARHGGPRPDPDGSHYAGQLGRHHLRWESHAEFVTYAAFTPGLPPHPFDPKAGAVFPADWQAGAPGKRVAAVLVQVQWLPDDISELTARAAEWFAPDSLAMSWILEEAAVVASDFRIDSTGWMRFAVFVRPGESDARVGRIVQRLTELETYRAMSMLGLSRSRSLMRQLNGIEARLSEIVDHMSADQPADALLHELLKVSNQLETQATQNFFRFGATAAYEAIVAERVKSLRETRFQGRQTLSEFMTRRYLPAMRTVKSAEHRLNAALERATRAGDLLRTRVDVERSAQNQAVLNSMDRRADLQLRLQHTVEGLSVVAISYYAVGLAAYALAPLAGAVGLDKAALLALLVPLVVGAVWLSLRRIKAGLHHDDP